jgi:hypothetical protein
MHRRLGIDIPESQNAIIFENDVGWNFAANNFRENRVTHAKHLITHEPGRPM